MPRPCSAHVGVSLGLLLIAAASPAAEPAWTGLIAEDTVAVAAAPVDAEAWRPVMRAVEGWLGPEGRRLVGRDSTAAEVLERLNQLGARDAALLLRLSDWQGDRGFVIAVGFDREPPAAAAKLLQDLADELHRLPNVEFPVRHTIVASRRLVLLGSEATLIRCRELLNRESPSARPELTRALTTEAQQRRAALVLALDDDSRRVVRELWPRLTEPFAEATGGLIADGLRGVLLSVRLAEAELVLTATAEDAPRAATLKRLIEAGRDRLVTAVVQQAMGHEDAEAKFVTDLAWSMKEFLEFRQAANLVTARFDPDEPRTRFLLGKLAGIWSEATGGAQRVARMNRFKQIALAMHNYHDTHGHFPAAAGFVDEQGKPLLSWRVALLPYLEEGPRYDLFRLDEPWDSPHNQQLLGEMPEVFADPARPELAETGRTTFQAPIGPQTVFAPFGQAEGRQRRESGPRLGVGRRFRELVDGTSNTVMVVEVEAGRAVPWTKPADWEVDPNAPLAGLRTEGEMVSGWADGHVETLPATRLVAEEFFKLLTMAGREVIDRDRLLRPAGEPTNKPAP